MVPLVSSHHLGWEQTASQKELITRFHVPVNEITLLAHSRSARSWRTTSVAEIALPGSWPARPIHRINHHFVRTSDTIAKILGNVKPQR